MIELRKITAAGMGCGKDIFMNLVCRPDKRKTLEAFLSQFNAIIYRDGTSGDYSLDILAKEGKLENGVRRVVDLIPLKSNISQIETPWSKESYLNYKVFMLPDRVEIGLKNVGNSLNLLRIWYSSFNYQNKTGYTIDKSDKLAPLFHTESF